MKSMNYFSMVFPTYECAYLRSHTRYVRKVFCTFDQCVQLAYTAPNLNMDRHYVTTNTDGPVFSGAVCMSGEQHTRLPHIAPYILDTIHT